LTVNFKQIYQINHVGVASPTTGRRITTRSKKERYQHRERCHAAIPYRYCTVLGYF